MWKNFFGGMLIEILIHAPLLQLNKSSCMIFWVPGYTLSVLMIGLYGISVYNIKNVAREERMLYIQTMSGIAVSFGLMKRFAYQAF